MQRGRIRDIIPSIVIGRYPTGPKNSLTDVPGVLVHTESLQRTSPTIVNTGVTTILPRKDWFNNGCHASIFSFNGCGELTGSHWLEESGLLNSPIMITNTFSVGALHHGIIEYAIQKYKGPNWRLEGFFMAVVGETYDGYLSDICSLAVKPDMAERGIEGASDGPVKEGNTGGGTGMFCHGYKGGTGSASRIVKGRKLDKEAVDYTVAALVQANYGQKRNLTIGNVPIGRLLIEEDRLKTLEESSDHKQDKRKKDGSIIVVIATNAPLHPTQLKRLATRATVGLSRVGGFGANSSGDIFLAFSTASHIPAGDAPSRYEPQTVATTDIISTSSMDALFEAVADCVEESIYNALTSAEDMVGPDGASAKGLPLDDLKRLMDKYYVPVPYV